MASPSIYCIGCGCDITNSKGNRLIRTTSSRHVVPLWSSLMKEEIDSRGTSLVTQLLIHDDGRMCRQCFKTFKRASKGKKLSVILANLAIQCQHTYCTPKTLDCIWASLVIHKINDIAFVVVHRSMVHLWSVVFRSKNSVSSYHMDAIIGVRGTSYCLLAGMWHWTMLCYWWVFKFIVVDSIVMFHSIRDYEIHLQQT